MRILRENIRYVSRRGRFTKIINLNIIASTAVQYLKRNKQMCRFPHYVFDLVGLIIFPTYSFLTPRVLSVPSGGY